MQRFFRFTSHVKKTRKLMRRLILFLFIVGSIACSKSNSDPGNNVPATSHQWTITKVEGPGSGQVNDSVPITVYWPYASGCDVLDRFEQTQQGDDVYIKAFGHTNYGFCTQMTGIKTKIFNFYTGTPGKYRLKFLNPDNSFFTHTVIIN